MEKKEFKRPSMKVMNVQTETILAGSGSSAKEEVGGNTASVIVIDKSSNW